MRTAEAAEVGVVDPASRGVYYRLLQQSIMHGVAYLTCRAEPSHVCRQHTNGRVSAQSTETPIPHHKRVQCKAYLIHWSRSCIGAEHCGAAARAGERPRRGLTRTTMPPKQIRGWRQEDGRHHAERRYA